MFYSSRKKVRMGDDSRDTLTTKARIAEQAERYEDMAKVISSYKVAAHLS